MGRYVRHSRAYVGCIVSLNSGCICGVVVTQGTPILVKSLMFCFVYLSDGDLQNLLNNMSQQQLMQLFGGVGQMGGLSSLLGTMRYVTHKFMIQNFILQPS
jgi:hypothetical protein